uniref:Uncharacterized protein n=1 Tax=Anguilla anguilla TaxID=7936 RepID=A0A0E9TEF8_ANGAN
MHSVLYTLPYITDLTGVKTHTLTIIGQINQSQLHP